MEVTEDHIITQFISQHKVAFASDLVRVPSLVKLLTAVEKLRRILQSPHHFLYLVGDGLPPRPLVSRRSQLL